ncbi:hypothetical protein LDENG_00297100, partial [Lucifuga dentata]
MKIVYIRPKHAKWMVWPFNPNITKATTKEMQGNQGDFLCPVHSTVLCSFSSLELFHLFLMVPK